MRSLKPAQHESGTPNPNRSLRRKLRSEGRAKLPRRNKTDQPAHFKLWMAEARIKKALSAYPMPEAFKMLSDHGLKPLGQKVQDAINARYETLWDLSRAPRADLLAIPGIGPGTLSLLEMQLIEAKCPVVWGASSGN